MTHPYPPPNDPYRYGNTGQQPMPPTAPYQQPSGYHHVPPPIPPQWSPLAQPPKKPSTAKKVLVGLGVGLFALFVIVGMTGGGKNGTTASTSGSTSRTAPTAAAPAAPASSKPLAAAATAEGIGDGTFLVGTDIQLGTYRSAGATPGVIDFCTWSTRAGASTNSKIIDFGTANADEPMVVEIGKSVKAFKSSGCEPWMKVG